MKSIITITLLLVAVALHAAEPQLPKDGFDRAFSLFTNKWQLCADSALAHKHYAAGFDPSGGGLVAKSMGRGPQKEHLDEIVQKKGINWITNASKISAADSLNGVEWAGFVYCVATAERWYYGRATDQTWAEKINKQGWADWITPVDLSSRYPKGVFEGYELSKKGGEWTVASYEFEPMTVRRVPDDYRPIACDVIQPAGIDAALQRKSQDAPSVEQCITNLKQIGLAARIWSTDHDHKFPKDFGAMKAELEDIKLLVCPADADRRSKAPKEWAEVTAKTVSYELVPGADETKPETVFARCLIHRHVVYSDGTVSK